MVWALQAFDAENRDSHQRAQGKNFTRKGKNTPGKLIVKLINIFFLTQVDIDELTELSLEYGIQSVPVLAVMKGGKVVNKSIGLQDTDRLRKFVEEAIKA
jgi:hypothetical protein